MVSERTKAIEQAISQIEKQFGKGAIMKLGGAGHVPVEAISTGSIALDLALGVGGLPRGRVVEIFGTEGSGKTTLALHTIASAQRSGGTAAFIDAEHALDAAWAGTCGVSTDDLLISQPDTGEQALEIAETLVRSGAVDIVVIDSVAALVPRAEIEGEMGDAHVGLQARLMSQALRKLTGSISKTKTCVIFVNQIREKIGILYGCFSYSTRVTLADGSQERIGVLVNQRRKVDVLTVEERSGEVLARPITDWFNNGVTEDFLVVRAHKPSGNGRAQFSATPDHQVLTAEGYARVRDLRAGDQVLTAQLCRLSPLQTEIIRGSLLGDSSLSRPQNEHSRGVKFRLGHCLKQREYLLWKRSFFENIPGSYWEREDGDAFWDSTPLPELYELREEVYQLDRKRFDDAYVESLTPLALALWYMDDGTFVLRGKMQDRGRIAICVEGMTIDSQHRLVAMLEREHGIAARLHDIREKAVLRLEQQATEKFHALIAPYVHPSMAYKLLPQHRGKFTGVERQFAHPWRRLVPAAIADIYRKPPPERFRRRYRYDLEVAGTHNYLVDGVVVHNSPETQPGGRALKFYASIRLDIRRVEPIKQGTDVIGNRVRVKVVKNKVAPPFKAVEFEILGSEGISREAGLIDMGIAAGVLDKSGSWINYGKERIGQGRENAKQFLREHPETAAKIEEQIREKAGQASVSVAAGADEA